MATAIAVDTQSENTVACPMCGHVNTLKNGKCVPCVACGEAIPAEQQAATTSLFSPMQIAGAAFLGGWLAGSIVMAINYLRLNRLGAALTSIGVGALMLIGWIKLAVSVPALSKVPGMLLWLVVMLVTLAIAKIVQGTDYDQHVAAGGIQAKGGAAVGYLIAAIGISIGLGVVLLLLLA